VGFAVPIDAARRSLHELLTKGRVEYAYAGVQTEDVTPALAEHLRLPVRRGALVDVVTPKGPAARAGLRGGRHEQEFLGESVTTGGDIVVAVGRTPVASADDLVRIVTNSLRPGRTAAFRIVRGTRRLTVPIVLEPRTR
jgi:2-alkenal reductase